MKACHIVYGYFPFDPRVRREVETLLRSGHEIDVIAMRETGQATEETVLGARVHRIPMPVVRGGKARYLFQYAVFFLAASALLLRLHYRRRFEVVHVHSLPDFQVFGAAAEGAMGARIVLDLHEAMPEILEARFELDSTSLWVKMAKFLERVSCAAADRVLVVNQFVENLLVKRGVGREKITVVMNSPDPSKFITTISDDLKTRLGVAGHRTIVYVGGINPERDLRLLIQAVADLKSFYPIQLMIFGYGDSAYREVLRGVANNEGLEDGFILGDRVPAEDVFAYVSMSELGPITYERNPLTELAVPNKVFEYAAAGKPLVIADLPALRALFGNSALYYTPGNSGELASQMKKLLDNPDLGNILAGRALEVLEKCSWRIMTRRLEEVYSFDRNGADEE